MEKKQYLTTDKELTATIQNDSDIEISYGRHFSIQKKIDNTWYSVPFTTNYIVNKDYYAIIGTIGR